MKLLYKSRGREYEISQRLSNLIRMTNYKEFEDVDSVNIYLEKNELSYAPVIIREISNKIAYQGEVNLITGHHDLSKDIFLRILIQRFFHISAYNKGNIQLVKNCHYSDCSVDNWTFGIITAGKRKDYIAKIIESIKSQEIPKCEVIICGNVGEIENYSNDYVKLINFNEKDDLGWITRKKNIIVESAKYNNICILHDRYILSDNWFSGFNEYGGDYDVLSLPQVFKNRNLPYWLENKAEMDNPYDVNKICPESYWSKHLYMPGGVNVFKKNVGVSIKYNESLFWNQKEDVELSRMHLMNGYLLRLNNLSTLDAMFSHWQEPSRLGSMLRKIKELCFKLVIKSRTLSSYVKSIEK
ncbi:hypothetical protein BH582_12160 [Vibrio sp. 10N.222.47.A9]|uniref:glycosyltransferase family A protein n=1 Tax=Vibrio sp. 10N.222.47.A9 TaxID=1903178 RepID=UPI0009768DCC|nr:glycosyltransferase family 2 protein [Vibrio sp. 10N.222.47.A9]OMO31695.1 hypothetical protein BH582_12160 [Vibrio sp. 10N.222.47.A9]